MQQQTPETNQQNELTRNNSLSVQAAAQDRRMPSDSKTTAVETERAPSKERESVEQPSQGQRSTERTPERSSEKAGSIDGRPMEKI